MREALEVLGSATACSDNHGLGFDISTPLSLRNATAPSDDRAE
ncbi:MAG: hypothetical protein QM784_27920 [Polyangiaceae bacterium]